jgi:Rieske Fe-S protein
MVVGGCDHKVGQKDSTGCFAEMDNQYKRFLQSDIADIEDLAKREGGVMNNSKTGKPTAIYKDDDGKTHSFSALCPHMKGVVCWALTEKSWDCPVHGSRFSQDGVYVIWASEGQFAADE